MRTRGHDAHCLACLRQQALHAHNVAKARNEAAEERERDERKRVGLVDMMGVVVVAEHVRHYCHYHVTQFAGEGRHVQTDPEPAQALLEHCACAHRQASR